MSKTTDIDTPKSPVDFMNRAKASLALFSEKGGLEAAAGHLVSAKEDIETALELARGGSEVHRASLGGKTGEPYILNKVPGKLNLGDDFSDEGLAKWWGLYDAAVSLEIALREEVSITWGASHGFNGWAAPMRFTDRKDPDAVALCQSLRANRKQAAQSMMRRFDKKGFEDVRGRLVELGAEPRSAAPEMPAP